MSLPKPKTVEIDEQSTQQYTATLKDETGTVIPLASIGTVLMTLIDKETGDIVNSRNAQNIKNANNVTIHATSGLLTWVIQPEDTTLQEATDYGTVREHLATITVTWSSTKKMHREILLKIRSLQLVPQS